MNLDNIYKKMEENSSGSDFYKIKEGHNKLRILSDFFEVQTINRGGKYGGIICPENKPKEDDQVRTQGWAWAIIRGDKAKGEGDDLGIVQFGKTILGLIVELKNSSEYGFSEMPMPYDIDLTANGAGTKEVKYAVIPARTNTEVEEEEFAKLNKKKPIPTIVETIIAKQTGKAPVKDELASYGKENDYPEYKGEPAF